MRKLVKAFAMVKQCRERKRLQKGARARRCVAVLGAVAVLSAGFWLPLVIFDNKTPALDMNSEYYQGKVTAWGPQPAAWLFLSSPRKTLYSGDEWYFSTFRGYCKEWVHENNYSYPQWPAY